LEGTSVQLPALTGGQILSMRVDEGQQVSKGDTLALIDTLELFLQLSQLKADLKNLEVQVNLARLFLTQAETDLEYVKSNHERIKILHQNNTSTKQTLDDLTNQLQHAHTNKAAARQNIQSLTAEKEKLLIQKRLIEKKISDAKIISPIFGIITSKYFVQSEAVTPMSPIVEIIDLEVMDIKIYISEKLLPHIQYRQKATIRIDGSEEVFEGKISWISPKAEFTPKSILTEETRTSLVYAVNVKVPNPDGILKHGMPVEVILE
jgi:HlyD family secretion protein